MEQIKPKKMSKTSAIAIARRFTDYMKRRRPGFEAYGPASGAVSGLGDYLYQLETVKTNGNIVMPAHAQQIRKMYENAKAKVDAMLAEVIEIVGKPSFQEGFLESLVEQILALSKQYEVSWTDSDFAVFFPPVILMGQQQDDSSKKHPVVVGPLVARLPYAWTSEQSIKVFATSRENRPKDHPAYFHPHVDAAGKLCFGDAGADCRLMLQQGELFMFFKTVHAVLKTYNHESPYIHLFRWFSEKCQCCANYVLNGDQKATCQACKKWACERCQKHKCRRCGVPICVNCGAGHSNCKACKRPVCLDQEGICSACVNLKLNVGAAT